MSLTVTPKRRACEYTKAIYWKLQWTEAPKQDLYFPLQNMARWTKDIYNKQPREKILGFIPPTSQPKLSDCRSESSLHGTRDFSWWQSTNGSVPWGNAWKGFHHYLEVRTHWEIRRCGFNISHVKKRLSSNTLRGHCNYKMWTLSAKKDSASCAFCCPCMVSILKQILQNESLVVLAHKRSWRQITLVVCWQPWKS